MGRAPPAQEQPREPRRLVLGARHDDALVEQRPGVVPPQPLAQRDDVADDDQRRGREARGDDPRGDVLERSDDDALSGARSGGDDRGRGRRGAPGVANERVGDRAEPPQAHEDADGPLVAGELLEIEGLPLAGRAAQEDDARGQVAVGQADAGVGRCGDGRGDARDDLVRNASVGKRLGLLGASPEQEGVATLEPNDRASASRELEDARVDLRLAQLLLGRLVAALADVLEQRVGSRQLEQLG